MEHSKINTLAQSPIPPEFDINKAIEWALSIMAFLLSYFKWVDKHFENKKTEKEKFIKDVVMAAMESSLSEFKADFHEFKDKTEAKMEDFNKTVLKIYANTKP